MTNDSAGRTTNSTTTRNIVTAGADATTADIADSSNKRYVTDAQLAVLAVTSGTNTGDQNLSGYALTTRALDTFGAPTDVTTLNATTSAHGSNGPMRNAGVSPSSSPV